MSSHTLKRDSKSTCLGKTDILTPGTSHGEDLDAEFNMKLQHETWFHKAKYLFNTFI